MPKDVECEHIQEIGSCIYMSTLHQSDQSGKKTKIQEEESMMTKPDKTIFADDIKLHEADRMHREEGFEFFQGTDGRWRGKIEHEKKPV